MSNLSKCIITPGKSSSCLRLAMLIHGFAIYMLSWSVFPVTLKIVGTLILLGQLGYILYRKGQLGSVYQLSFEQSECTILYKNGQNSLYDTFRVVLDAGIFFLLEVSNGHARKTMVVFFDQISASNYRTLKLLEKIH